MCIGCGDLRSTVCAHSYAAEMAVLTRAVTAVELIETLFTCALLHISSTCTDIVCRVGVQHYIAADTRKWPRQFPSTNEYSLRV
jgi:hypothetical protein